jgi:hypothetical protein
MITRFWFLSSVLFLLALVFPSPLQAQEFPADARLDGQVAIHADPDQSSEVVRTLAFAFVTVIGQSKDGAWYNIQVEDGTEGWVPVEAVNFVEAEAEEVEQVLIENVAIASGGVAIYEQPDTSSTRLLAAGGGSGFAPHVAGISAAGDWLYVYYVDGDWLAGWARVKQLILTEDQLATLPEIDPNNRLYRE